MKKITPPKLKDLFQYNEGLNDFVKFHEEVKIYNPFTFMVLATSLLVFMGFFKREAFLLAVSLITYMCYQYFALKRSANGIFFVRKAPTKARERERLTFTYSIRNLSAIDQNNYLLYDNFTGAQKGRLTLRSPQKLKAHSQTNITHDFLADGGMGLHNISSLKIALRDALGLYTITIENDGKQDVEIYPTLEPIPQLKYRFNSLSYHFGEKDIPHRGDSINFYGTRQYRAGDPIKTINWRLSAKHRETIVNIFEKNVNKSITLLLNRERRLHSGLGSQSTMEYLKDFILAVASQNISNGNEVEVITNELKSPLGSGQQFINRLEFFLFELDTIEDPKAAQLITDTIKIHQDWEATERSLIYFTPIVPGPLFENNMEQVMHLKSRQKQVEVVLVDAFSFLDQRLKFGGPLSVKHQLSIVLERKKYWQEKCRLNDIPCYCLDVNDKASFPVKVRQSMEEMWKS